MTKVFTEKQILHYEEGSPGGPDPVLYRRPRFYNPAVARFTEMDSFDGDIQSPQSLHKYLYANANPIMNVDPSGCFSFTTGCLSFEWLSQLGNMSAEIIFAQVNGNRLVTPDLNTTQTMPQQTVNTSEVGLDQLSRYLLNIAPPGQQAHDEANRIAAAINFTYSRNCAVFSMIGGYTKRGVGKILGKKIESSTNKGYYCYEWAYAFEDAFNLESSGHCFSVKVEAAAKEGDLEGRVHYWIAITSLGGTKNTIYVDDGFSDGSYVHTNRPIPEGYIIGSSGDMPRDQCSPPVPFDHNGQLTFRDMINSWLSYH
jgi:RHS repeat-associated protein